MEEEAGAAIYIVYGPLPLIETECRQIEECHLFRSVDAKRERREYTFG